MKKQYSIQLLRFVFCMVIVNYHFYSLFLKYHEQLPNYFCRGYLADEFFFMVSGFFLAYTAVRAEGNEGRWTVNYVIRRIKKIAVPYYFSWLLCFAGGRIADAIAGKSIRLLPNLLNSVYELCFLEMFGFTKGLYSNSVGWFFSALLISIFIISPLIMRFRKNYVLYIAPLSGLLMLGMLSLQFDYLYYPHKVIGEAIPILKGTVRALAEINLGVFLYGIYELMGEKQISGRLLNGLKCIAGVLWAGIVFYMVFPFKSNSAAVAIQYDFIFTILIFVSLAVTLVVSGKTQKKNSRIEQIEDKLGVFSIYIFFGQPVLYTVSAWYFSLPLRTLYKFLLFNLIVLVFSVVVLLVDKTTRNFQKRVSKNVISG